MLLHPMADVMRYFRYGYAADDSVFALTVGVWPCVETPLSTVPDVEDAVVGEAHACGYALELLRVAVRARWVAYTCTLVKQVSHARI